MPRLFTGLELPADTRLALSLKRGGLSGARWMEAENYHITLRFIGDVDKAQADEIAEVLDRLTNSSSFSVRLDQLGAFGGSRPRTLYAGVEPNEAMVRLQAAQERLLQHIGLPAEGRKFTPHVTLARLRGTQAEEAARFISEAGRFSPLEFSARRFVLFSSRDSVGGGPYRIEQSYPLSSWDGD